MEQGLSGGTSSKAGVPSFQPPGPQRFIATFRIAPRVIPALEKKL
jgi:hypothetical protein